MSSLMDADEKYKDLELVEIAYGEDNTEKSAELTQKLLEDYPDLKLICAPTTVGIAAAAQVLADEKSSVQITGLGMPSQMASFIGENQPCPYMYFWNPVDLGNLAANVAINIENGSLEVKAGSTFNASDLDNKTFEIVESATDPGSCEVLLGDLICFTAENVHDWEDTM